jgi:hypothetical protein
MKENQIATEKGSAYMGESLLATMIAEHPQSICL